MKKIMCLTLFLICFFQVWCENKGKDDVIEYFNNNYQDFENIKSYLSGVDFYFSCLNRCNIKSNTWEYLHIDNLHLSYGRGSEKFETMPILYQEYFQRLSNLFSWEMKWIQSNKNFLRFSLKNSSFFIVYILPENVDGYDKCFDMEKYFWNITGNWYYSFHDYDVCEGNKKES